MTFRILSVDGGGVRGFLAASILANMEAYLDRLTSEHQPIGRRFDLITGTSAGGLIALALAHGRHAAEVRDLFTELVPRVFGKANRRQAWQRLKKPLYGSAPLQDVLTAFFRDGALADLVVDACVTSVSLIDAKPRLH